MRPKTPTEITIQRQAQSQPFISDTFHRKIPAGTISPVYVAQPSRPSIITRVASEVARHDSNSRSNSRNKITISYGKIHAD